jgi:hypothetical protein
MSGHASECAAGGLTGIIVIVQSQPMHHLLANAGLSFSFAVFSIAQALLL